MTTLVTHPFFSFNLPSGKQILIDGVRIQDYTGVEGNRPRTEVGYVKQGEVNRTWFSLNSVGDKITIVDEACPYTPLRVEYLGDLKES